MTEQIKSRIEKATNHLGSIPFCRLNTKQGESVEMAIRSLQAWKEILTELDAKQKSIHDCALNHEDDLFLGEVIGIASAIEVINQHLAEI